MVEILVAPTKGMSISAPSTLLLEHLIKNLLSLSPVTATRSKSLSMRNKGYTVPTSSGTSLYTPKEHFTSYAIKK